MTGLSRRQFVSRVGALAALWGMAPGVLGDRLAVAQTSPEAPLSTLSGTILRNAGDAHSYRTLTAAPGENYVQRLDILRAAPSPVRARIVPHGVV